MTEEMEVDHYETLGIPDTADEREIIKAYRKHAMEVHPDRNPGMSNEMIQKVNKARDVLLDRSKRRDYDSKRRDKMKKRGGGVSGGRVHKEKNKKTPTRTVFRNRGAQGAGGSAYSEFENSAQGAEGFQEYAESNANQTSSGPKAEDTTGTPNFGGNNGSTQYNSSFSSDANDTEDDPNFRGGSRSSPYNFSFDQGANFSSDNSNAEKESTQREEEKSGFGAESGHQEDLPHKKPSRREDTSTSSPDSTTNEAYVVESFLTLEQVFQGCMKDMTFSRLIQLADGTSEKEEMTLTFQVKKGWKAGTKIIFGKNAQTWTNPEKDIVIIMRDEPRENFTRNGSDLLYTAEVSARQIELGSSIDIPTLDGGKRCLSIPVDFVDDPNLFKTIKGEGLPFPREPTKRGDLIVKFVSAS